MHHQNCSNLKALDEPERLLEVSWGETDSRRYYRVPISIIAYDRAGLMRDISTLLAEEKINLSEVAVTTKQEIATFQLTMEINDLTRLSRVMTRVEDIPSVGGSLPAGKPPEGPFHYDNNRSARSTCS